MKLHTDLLQGWLNERPANRMSLRYHSRLGTLHMRVISCSRDPEGSINRMMSMKRILVVWGHIRRRRVKASLISRRWSTLHHFDMRYLLDSYRKLELFRW